MKTKPTILVCGAAGFMGSDFVRYMMGKKSTGKIIVYDKLTYAGNLDNLAPVAQDKRYTFIKGDICDVKKLQQVITKYKPEVLINYAAQTHVDQSIHGKAHEFVKDNVYGVHALLELVNKNKSIEKYIQISTDEVYGDTPFNSKEVFTESSALRPSNPYSVTKASGDLMCLAYHRTYDTPVMVTRSGNNYGPHQYPEKFIPQSIFRALTNKKIPLYGSGKHIRDWVYVRDHSRAIETILNKGKLGEIYNVDMDAYHQNIDVARSILELVGADAKLITFVKDRPGHDRRYAPNARKLKKLGWKPQYTFEKGLKATLKWYQDNPKWVAKVSKKLKKVNPHIRG